MQPSSTPALENKSILRTITTLKMSMMSLEVYSIGSLQRHEITVPGSESM